MALWRIERLGRTPYDGINGLVVRARDEAEARGVAVEEATRYIITPRERDSESAVFSRPEGSKCERLDGRGKPEVILSDVFEA
jgi:hypothetical protein